MVTGLAGDSLDTLVRPVREGDRPPAGFQFDGLGALVVRVHDRGETENEHGEQQEFPRALHGDISFESSLLLENGYQPNQTL